MEIRYKMSKEMYNGIKYRKFWDPKSKKMVNGKDGLSEKEIIQHVNNTFGLRGKVTQIVID